MKVIISYHCSLKYDFEHVKILELNVYNRRPIKWTKGTKCRFCIESKTVNQSMPRLLCLIYFINFIYEWFIKAWNYQSWWVDRALIFIYSQDCPRQKYKKYHIYPIKSACQDKNHVTIQSEGFIEDLTLSTPVLLNLLSKLRKRDKMRGLPRILSLFRNEFINSILQEHEC